MLKVTLSYSINIITIKNYEDYHSIYIPNGSNSYRRSVFNCEYLLIANCEFFSELAIKN